MPAVHGRKPKFVYFGGGTPSYLSPEQLRFLTDGMKRLLPWDEVEEVTFLLLVTVARFHASMRGAFDITVGPLLSLWREAARRGRLPSATELDRAAALVDAHCVRLGPMRRAMLDRRGQRLDLGDGDSAGGDAFGKLDASRQRMLACACTMAGETLAASTPASPAP